MTFTGFMVTDNYYDQKHAYEHWKNRDTLSVKIGDTKNNVGCFDQILDCYNNPVKGYIPDWDATVIKER